MNIFMTAIAFIILLSLIVFVHELGHFLFARLYGVKVIRFSIGIGKPIFSRFDKYGTEWCVSALPLGGYVTMLGQSDLPESEKARKEKRSKLTKDEKSKSYEFKNRFQKIMIALGGPLFNFIFAFIVFTGLFLYQGSPIKVAFTIKTMLPNAPIISSGIKTGDEILAINNKEITNNIDLRETIKNLNGAELLLKVKRGDKNLSFKVKPLKQHDRYVLGVVLGDKVLEYERLTFMNSIKASYYSIEGIVTGTSKGLWQMITGKRSSKELGGIISIAKISKSAFDSGFYSYLFIMAVISVSLGLFNIFPIPMLDGGYILLYLIESVIRRYIPEKIQAIIFKIGFGFIIFLMILSNVNDLLRLFFKW